MGEVLLNKVGKVIKGLTDEQKLNLVQEGYDVWINTPFEAI